MKTTLQKHKYILEEIKKKQAVLAELKPEARALANQGKKLLVKKIFIST